MRALAFFVLLRCTAGRAFPGCIGSTLEGCPGTHNCTARYFEQTIDHFNWAPPLGGAVVTYQQRYFVDEQWWSPGNPIFFYFGNEDDVALYVNHTGLMWENAEEFKAMLVWAEHRYYGESLLFADGTPGCMNWLTTEQALADFAVLIEHLQATYGGGTRLPVVGFGGSYGGQRLRIVRPSGAFARARSGPTLPSVPSASSRRRTSSSAMGNWTRGTQAASSKISRTPLSLY